jgi:hypothetical protein
VVASQLADRLCVDGSAGWFAKLPYVTVLEQRCRQTLEGSWIVGERDGVPFAYTRPSPGRYRWQWYWDSCFAAIAWRPA